MSENAGDSSTTKPNLKRNGSGELDVFEATRYFSDFNEPTMTEYSRIQVQKQSTVTELRQKRIHPETENKLPEPRVVIVKPKEKEKKTRGGGGKKLTSFLNSLLRSAGLKNLKSKSKSIPEVESPRGERRRRHSCVVTVTTHAEASSPISGAGAWSTRRRSFDEKHVKGLGSKKSDQKLNMRLCESLCSDKKVECKDRKKEVDVNGGYESDSVTTLVLLHLASIAFASSHGSKQLGDQCSSDEECSVGLGCFKCGIDAARCVRSNITDQFSLVNNSMPFNKYAFLTTHNSYAIEGKPLHVATQEDSITEQLNSGVRALMLDTYDYEGDVWLCHSFHEQCFEFTKFNRAIDTFEEVFAFLTANPSEIVTIFLEDYVKSPNALTKVFTDSGLKKFWFPVEDMPKGGQDWPLVKDMVANNHRLVVFTSDKSKQETEGIAYQWNYVLENQYGDDGVKPSECSNRGESAQLTDKTKALVLINHFSTIPVKLMSCEENSQHLIDTIKTCYVAAGDRWANFVAVDFYKRSDGGGTFQAVDKLNGELLCGRDDVHDCHQ
ncbi:unnamed protein product [Brassica oleracea]|uniref:(rape) hypothetical protein n=1 Tax=Brassica napus TaxID=3708 RepID=A0A816KPY7_BRANA|nr:unnamed protein product [Brassica napus]